MHSPIILATALESGLGFALTGTVSYLVLTRGRKPYHQVFGAFLLVCAVWDSAPACSCFETLTLPSWPPLATSSPCRVISSQP
jgi:hypothetical protein